MELIEGGSVGWFSSDILLIGNDCSGFSAGLGYLKHLLLLVYDRLGIVSSRTLDLIPRSSRKIA